MARLVFTSHLGGVAPKDETQFPGRTVGEVLTACFAAHPGLEHYILDDQRHVRKHLHIFLGDRRLDARLALITAARDSDEIYVLQALSGGADQEAAP